LVVKSCGLYGAKHYCQNPVFPIEKTVAYFNLDMVATGSGLRVGGVESFPKSSNVSRRQMNELIHRPLMTSKYRKPGVGRPRSDGSIFAKAGIKAFSFGTFYQKGEKRLPFYYHILLMTSGQLTLKSWKMLPS
jgi:Zn-dependent M28 family amino/carboxypeptidase